MTPGEAYDFITTIAQKRRDLLEKTIRDVEG
jgi:hypothetical protein